METCVEKAREDHPSIPEIDFHFYGIKGHGLNDRQIQQGRPKFHLIGSDKLFSLVPLISSDQSPYVVDGDTLTYRGEDLPFRVKFIKRIDRRTGYFYYRGIQEWIPTLDSETILNLNFQQICRGCEWCYKEIDPDMRNLSPEEGIDLLRDGGVSFPDIDEMAFCTGMYRDGDEVVETIVRTVELAKEEGFGGRLLYIGSQIQTPAQVRDLLSGLGETEVKYAFTLETFTQRGRMRREKSESLETALSTLDLLREGGIVDLEYSYMPGLDPLRVFSIWMPRFSRLARPHISIFRPNEEAQEGLKDPYFLEDPVGYLCEMRLAFEEEHGEPIYQNNLASLWGFPTNRIDPVFLTDRTSL